LRDIGAETAVESSMIIIGTVGEIATTNAIETTIGIGTTSRITTAIRCHCPTRTLHPETSRYHCLSLDHVATREEPTFL
jgi:hypothetical protein